MTCFDSSSIKLMPGTGSKSITQDFPSFISMHPFWDGGGREGRLTLKSILSLNCGSQYGARGKALLCRWHSTDRRSVSQRRPLMIYFKMCSTEETDQWKQHGNWLQHKPLNNVQCCSSKCLFLLSTTFPVSIYDLKRAEETVTKAAHP